MNSQSKTTEPSSVAPSVSRAERLARMHKILDKMEVDLKGVEPPIDSFAAPDPSEAPPIRRES